MHSCPVQRSRRLHLHSGAAMALCLWLLCDAAGAAQPAPYGERFVRSDLQLNAIAPEPSSTSSGGSDRALYEQQLTLVEQQGGPYSAELAEPLAGLARVHRDNGDLAESRRLYERALHLVRVNEGLYSERQIPILRQLFTAYREAGDMQTLDARYEYYFRLYGQGQPPYTPLRVAATLEYLRWQREALLLGLDGDDSRRLLDLHDLNTELLAAWPQDATVDYPSYRSLAYSQLANLYLLQDRYRPDTQSKSEPPNTLTAVSWDREDISQYRLETLQRNAIAEGREVVEALVARTPPGEPVEAAAAWLALGDWYQWNDKRSDAGDAYREALDLLRGAGRDDLAVQWFASPVELPANGVFLQTDAALAPKAMVRATFDVSATGRAENIEANAAAAEQEGKVNRFIRELRQTRFRPRFVDGEPRPADGLQRQYSLLR